MQTAFDKYTRNLKAKVGVAVIVNDRDTIEVNGDREFPMFSVFKFPLALAVAEYSDRNGGQLSDVINIDSKSLIPDTWSPMLKKYGQQLSRMSLRELLEWSLQESDNNAADILLNYVGGLEGLNSLMQDLNFPPSITIGANEEDMNRDNYKSYLNRSNPKDMASLFNRFNNELRNRSKSFAEIGKMMENCNTGTDRLQASLNSTDAILGHKTGTGFITSDNIISALNDCGYVNLPDGSHYSIAVFVADSPYTPEETTRIIAELSKIAYSSLYE
ncbi:MAG: class A beta-lactamase [Muribaculaceae bacterium]|nr:class A beta-lactamase [Muribaculaceae bacterium]